MSDQPTRTLEAPQYAAFITRSIRAFGRRAGESDPAAAAEYFAVLRDEIDRAEQAAITQWLAVGFSYRDLGRAFGVAHNAIIQRFRRLSGAA